MSLKNIKEAKEQFRKTLYDKIPDLYEIFIDPRYENKENLPVLERPFRMIYFAKVVGLREYARCVFEAKGKDWNQETSPKIICKEIKKLIDYVNSKSSDELRAIITLKAKL